MAKGIAGHSDLLAARYLPLMMEGTHRQRINKLTPGSIDSWNDMRKAFIQHFEGSYEKGTSIADLEACIQGRHESTRSWIRRWQELWMHAYNIHPQLAIHTMKNCCRYEPFVAKFKRDGEAIETVAEAITVAKRYAEEDPNQEDATRRSNRVDDRRSEMRYSNTRVSGTKRRNNYGSDLVASTNYSSRDKKSSCYSPSGNGARPVKKFNAVSAMNQPCIFHSKEGFPSRHTTGQCQSLKEIEKVRRNGNNNGNDNNNNTNKGPDPQQPHNDDPGFGREVGSLHPFIGLDNRREKKVLTRAVSVNTVTTNTTRYLNWSEQPIGWSREDHPRRVEYPRRCALIVRPKIGDYWLDTFARLGLPQSIVEHSNCTFHGIVPGCKAYSLGKVFLPVTFGTPANFRTGKIMFELVNFRSPYHCILGRQALAKFMASTHYAYNIMKIPGPNGPISIHGDPAMALKCESEGGRMADAVLAEEENKQEALTKYTSGVDSNDPSILKKPTTPSSAPATFEASESTRRVELNDGDSSHMVAFTEATKCPKWLFNPVLVQKKNGTWRLCIDLLDEERDRARSRTAIYQQG